MSPRAAASPNHDARPAGMPVDMLILHYTGMREAAEAIARLRDPAPPTGTPVSCHWLVEEDGTVWALVDEARRAWHAGVSFWRGAERLNGRSVGVEIANPGHEFGYREFPPAQMAAVRDLCRGILARHPIPARNVVAHSDVAPERKQDPGEKFDWRALAWDGVGLWPEAPDAAPPLPAGVAAVRAALAAIGYRVAPTGAHDPALAAVLRAFQRHWRPASVDGEADAETRTLIAALACRAAAGHR